MQLSYPQHEALQLQTELLLDPLLFENGFPRGLGPMRMHGACVRARSASPVPSPPPILCQPHGLEPSQHDGSREAKTVKLT